MIDVSFLMLDLKSDPQPSASVVWLSAHAWCRPGSEDMHGHLLIYPEDKTA